MKNKIKNKKGITLLEVIIVVSIIVIMTTASIVYMGRGRADTFLKAAQTEVSATIKLAQSFALQGKMQSVPICGYGIRFNNSNTYQIFYQRRGASIDCKTKNSPYVYNASESVAITGETHSLPRGVILNPYDLNNSIIFFEIPHGNGYSFNSVPFSSKIFQFSLNGRTKNIAVYPTGNIVSN